LIMQTMKFWQVDADKRERGSAQPFCP